MDAPVTNVPQPARGDLATSSQEKVESNVMRIKIEQVVFTLARLQLLVLTLLSVVWASPLDYRTFTDGSQIWIAERDRLMVYNTETQTVRSVTLSSDHASETDTIYDILESEGRLWICAESGIYSMMFGSGTVERIPTPQAGSTPRRISVDYDYVWTVAGNSIWRYDRLGREWDSFDFQEDLGRALAVHSNEDEVFVVTSRQALSFDPFSEKWRAFANPGEPLGESTHFFRNDRVIVLIDESRLVRFDTDAKAWENMTVSAPVQDVVFNTGGGFFLSTESRIYEYATDVGNLRPLRIPNMPNVLGIAAEGDSLFIPTSKHVYKYNVKDQSTDNIIYGDGISVDGSVKVIVDKSVMLLFSREKVQVYERDAEAWRSVNLGDIKTDARFFSWDEQGLSLGRKRQLTLRGEVRWQPTLKSDGYYHDSIETGESLYRYDYKDTSGNSKTFDSTQFNPELGLAEDSTYLGPEMEGEKTNLLLVKPEYPTPLADLNLHADLAGDRYLDLFFAKPRKEDRIDKGLRYRGGHNDIVSEAAAGTNEMVFPSSEILPKREFEGADLALQGKSRLSTLDRRILKATSGAGWVTSRERTVVLEYAESGDYVLLDDADGIDSTEIIPGSVRIEIDGEEIDSREYVVFFKTGSVNFEKTVGLDPTSVITVTYSERTLPRGERTDFETIPSRTYGEVGYVHGTASPTEWLSTRAGYMRLQSTDTIDLVTAAAPLEFRSSNLLLKLTPEIAFDGNNLENGRAGALALNSRLGKRIGIKGSGLIADTGYVGTDILTRGYGRKKHEIEYEVSYDITDAFPVYYRQHDRVAVGGSEHRYEIGGKARPQGLPNIDVSLSRGAVDATFGPVELAPDSTGEADIADTSALSHVNQIKDRLKIKVFETSSPFLQKLLNLEKVWYDLSYTEFRTDIDGDSVNHGGRFFVGEATFSPMSKLFFGGSGTYRKNPVLSRNSRIWEPKVRLWTLDLPAGVDVTADYGISLGRRTHGDSSSWASDRQLELGIRPGEWFESLGWVNLRSILIRKMGTTYENTRPGFLNTFYGPSDPTEEERSQLIQAILNPWSFLQFQTVNTWAQNRQAGRTFTTSEDLKMWIGDRGVWETNSEYRIQSTDAWSLSGRSRFKKGWNTWLNTAPGAQAQYGADSLGNTSMTVGPELWLSFTFSKWSFLRYFTNNHTIRSLWKYDQGKWSSTPNLAYALVLNSVIEPNLMTNISLTVNPLAETGILNLTARVGAVF